MRVSAAIVGDRNANVNIIESIRRTRKHPLTRHRVVRSDDGRQIAERNLTVLAANRECQIGTVALLADQRASISDGKDLR